MDIINIKNVKFGSFIKLSIFISLSFGIILGLIVFVVGVFGGPVYANIGTTRLTGFAGGVASLVISPIIFTLFGLLNGIFSFLPFKLVLKVFKCISIHGEFEAVETYKSIIINDDLSTEQSEEK